MRLPTAICTLVLTAGCQPVLPATLRPAPPRRPAFVEEAPPVIPTAPSRAVSTGGHRVAWMQGDAVAILEDGVVTLVELPGEGLHGGRLSPDGLALAAVTARGELVVSAIPWKTPRRYGVAAAPSWAPEGDRIACESGEGLWTIELSGGTRTWLGSGATPAWSPDGSRIVFTLGAPPSLWIMTCEGADRRILPTPSDVHTPAWSPDSRWIAFASFHHGRPDDLWAVSADGASTVRITWDPLPESEPHWGAGNLVWYTRTRGGVPSLWTSRVSNPELLP